MTRRRTAIFVSGWGTNMTALLDAMDDPAYPAEAALVLSNNPAAAGLTHAAARGIATAAIDHRPFGKDRAAFEAALQDRLGEARIDLICLAGFLRILTADFVNHWRDRMVNIHPSLIPAFKGLDTHRRALDAGVAFHGCTVHLVRAEMDDGPILGQAMLRVPPAITADDLAAEVLKLEHRLYPQALSAYLTGRIRLEGEIFRPAPLSLTRD
ncbi:MAG: phosphoribosylglycinamide formyltransferase [Pseudomonadota bacterium]